MKRLALKVVASSQSCTKECALTVMKAYLFLVLRKYIIRVKRGDKQENSDEIVFISYDGKIYHKFFDKICSGSVLNIRRNCI